MAFDVTLLISLEDVEGRLPTRMTLQLLPYPMGLQQLLRYASRSPHGVVNGLFESADLSFQREIRAGTNVGRGIISPLLVDPSQCHRVRGR